MNTKIPNPFKFRGDIVIWVIFFLLSAVSIALVYSASSMVAVSEYGGSNIRLLFKQLMVVTGGFFIATLFSAIDYKKLKKFFFLAFVILVPLLLITMLTGRNVNSASRWFQIPIVHISLQVADVAKVILIGLLALNISRIPFLKTNSIKPKNYIIIAILLPITLVVGLIVKGNMSTALLLMISAFFIMWLGKIKIKYMLAYSGVMVSLFVIVVLVKPEWFPRLDTWKSRVENYQNVKDDKTKKDDAGEYQLQKAKIAIASAPLFGKLPGKSRQRALLYSAHTDFIYAILIEEYSLFAGILMVLLYLILLYRGQLISRKSNNLFGSLLAYGLIFGVVVQAFIHMSVNTALIPVTGQPLPLVSMGGSNFWFTCLALGIVQNIAHQNKMEKAALMEQTNKKLDT